MAQPIPFINRETEVGIIEKIIREIDTQRIIGVRAAGGVGKTRLLQRIRELYPGHVSVPLDEAEIRKPISIALVQELTGAEWSGEFLSGVRSMAEELDITLFEKDAHFDVEQMATDLNDAIDDSPDAIIISLGSNAKLQDGISEAVAKGIKILTFDNYLDAEGITARVSQDDYEGARICGEKLAQDLNFRGNIVVGWVQEFKPLERRKRMLDTILERYPEIQLVDEFGVSGENIEEESYQKIKKILRQREDVQAVWVTWNDFAKGVVRALHELQRSDIAVYSFDLCPTDVAIIAQPGSPWKATVGINPYEGGRIVVRLAAAAVLKMDIQKQYYLPMQLFTQEELLSSPQPQWNASSIGWTPFLRARAKKTSPTQQVFVSDIIDLDDRTYQVSQNLARKLAETVDDELFAPYLQALQDYRRMERSGVSTDRLEREEKVVNSKFMECFNQVTNQRRIVVLLDTLEALPQLDALQGLLELGKNSRNMVWILAGRPEAHWEVVEALDNHMPEIIDIAPLTQSASKEYLQVKQRNLHTTLDSELSEKLLVLAQGRPILIDLAVEWVLRRIPLDWLISAPLDELTSLSDEERVQRQDEFEYQLVRHIADTRSNADWLLLTLAQVYPLNRAMIAEFVQVSPERAGELFLDMQTRVFIKPQPGGYITLHDEMRRMVNEHAWPEVDPTGKRRKEGSKIYAEYFAAQAQRIEQQIHSLKPADDSSMLHESLWRAQYERLKHLLAADVTAGFLLFGELFDAATRSYDSREKGIMVNIVQEYNQQIPPDYTVEFQRRMIQYWRDSGHYEDAITMAVKILDRSGISIDKRLEILALKASCHERLGEFQEANAALQDALGISQKYPELKHTEGNFLNFLGRVNRSLGRIDEAQEYYMQTLQIAKEKSQIATALNNVGHLWSEQGRYRSAFNYCAEALKFFRQEGKRLQEGSTLLTIGEVHRNWGKYKEALDYYNQALRIFEPEDEPFWLARTYMYLGAAYRLDDRLELSENFLLRSIECNQITIKPQAHHILGCVYLNQGRIEDAVQYFKESERLCNIAHDIRGQINNIVGFAELYYSQWEDVKDPALAKKIREKAAELEGVLSRGYQYPHHHARMQRVMANLYFDEGDYDAAFSYYVDAYASLGIRTGGYAARTDFFKELDKLADRIRQLARVDYAKAQSWCEQFRTVWSDQNRDIRRRDELESLLDILELELNLYNKQAGTHV